MRDYFDDRGFHSLSQMFARKRFDVDKAIEKRYLSGDVAVIVYNTDDIDSIIDTHAPEGYDMVSGAFVDYISYHTEFISSNYPLVVEICGMKLDEEDRKRVKRAYQAYYDMELGMYRHEKLEMLKKTAYNLIMAAITYQLYTLTKQGFAPAICDGFNLFFFLFANEFAYTFVYRIKDMMDRHKKTGQMASASIKFYEEYIDSKYSEEEQTRLIHEILNRG